MATNYGVKISKEGYNVLTATEQQLAFSSSFPVLRATLYGLISISGVTEVTHSLGYRPAFEVWAKGSTYRFKLPRISLGSDPVGGGIYGWCWADTTKLYISTTATEVYYYIFVDPIT